MSIKKNPILTVVIPVYNGEKYLRQSLESVFNQVCSHNFEVLVLNDGSTDGSLEIAKEFELRYPNLRVIDMPKTGLVGVLNRSLETVDTQYISRHDADDIMMQNRIELQINQILENSDLNCIGGQIIAFSETMRPNELRVNMYPTDSLEIKSQLVKKNVFASPTVTFCRNCARNVGGYRASCDGAEDYDLWLRMAKRGIMHNTRTVLTQYRVHPEQVTQAKKFKVYRATFLAKMYFLFGSKAGLIRFNYPQLNCHSQVDFHRGRKVALLYFLVLDFLRFFLIRFKNRMV